MFCVKTVRNAFLRWKANLTPEEAEKLTEGTPGPRDRALEHVWRKEKERKKDDK